MLQKKAFEGLGFLPECGEVELHSEGTKNAAQFLFFFAVLLFLPEAKAGEAGAGQ